MIATQYGVTVITDHEVFLKRLYRHYILPTADNEDVRRRQFIFTVLLFGTILLIFAALCSMVASIVIEASDYDGWSPITMTVPLLLLVGLYIRSRRHFSNLVVYPLLLLYLGLGSIGLAIYGYALPEGLLGFTLVIILTGIMISARAAVVVTAIIMTIISVLAYLQLHMILKPDASSLIHPIRLVDLFVYFFIFTLILLASWLSGRDIERSLLRARSSEAALRKERNSLEVKVRQRTRQLEQAQIEKMLELHRFAEFGRMSSSLLHDLANPLMVVSLNLEQLGGKRQSTLVAEARKGIAHIERYVQAARRQLQYQSEIKLFSVADEIRQVVSLLETKARINNVFVSCTLDDQLTIKGDSIQFDHVIANLLANAIDAYEKVSSHPKTIVIGCERNDGRIKITMLDHAIGIKAAELKHVFEAFFTTKDTKYGTGIGLSIVKQVVEQDFGGTITVKSSPRAGTCFTIMIPL